MATWSAERDALIARHGAARCAALTGRCLILVLFAVITMASPVFALDCPPLAHVESPESAATAHHHGLLWRVTAPSGARSTLLGTMHVADPRVTAMLEVASAPLAAAETFVMEVVFDAQAIATLQQAMFYADGEGLHEHLEPALFARAISTMRAYGFAEEVVARMKPWAVLLTLSQPAGEIGAALDLRLMEQARAAGKDIRGLETVTEQLGLFETLDVAEQVDFLREVVCHHAFLQAAIEEMIERYAARDLAGLLELSLRHVGAHGERFVDALVWQRNARMLERLIPLFDVGGVFVAVGALHLPGPRGLLQGLERDGYTVEVID